jgi:nucleoid-associated protein YgaU
MAKWTQNSVILQNNDKIYQKFFNKIGAQKIDHLSIILYGDPINDNFLKKLSISKHIYSSKDSLSRIAFKQYGDPRLWWVISWFNGKPTDLDCKIGDIILIPHPIEEVLMQAYERKNI